MSLPIGRSGEAAAPQPYFCHQCSRTVTLTPSTSSDLLCPDCNGGFLVELEIPNPRRVSTPFSFPSFPLIFSTSSSIDGGVGAGAVANDLSEFFSGGPTRASPSPFQYLDGFNPLLFLQNYLQNGNVQSVIQSGEGIHPGTAANSYQRRSQSAGLSPPQSEALAGENPLPPMPQWAERSRFLGELEIPNPRQVSTPFSFPSYGSAGVGSGDFPLIFSTSSSIDGGVGAGAVANDLSEFFSGGPTRASPSPFQYLDGFNPLLFLQNYLQNGNVQSVIQSGEGIHPGTAANSYQRRSQSAGLSPPQSEALAGENPLPPMPQWAERSIRRISLPWPFRAFGSSAETSNSGSGNRRVNNNESNPHGENQNTESGARYEDLD